MIDIVNPVDTDGTVSANACALGSPHGLVFEGQLKIASFVCGDGDDVKLTFIVVGPGAKEAMAVVDGALTLTLQVRLMPQVEAAPPQPPNVEPSMPGAAVSISTWPEVSVSMQWLFVITPPASAQDKLPTSVTCPVPVPINWTVKFADAGKSNWAVTVVFEVNVSVQG